MKPPVTLALALYMGAAAIRIAGAQSRTAPDPDELIAKARDTALAYTASLPDFICTQVVERYVDLRGNNRWDRNDVLTLKLGYSGHQEDYTLTAIDGKPTNLDYLAVGGAVSTGQFGTMLRQVFDERAKAQFKWKGWTTAHKRRLAVFTYRIERQNSGYLVQVGHERSEPNAIFVAIHGEVHVDPDTGDSFHVSQIGEMPDGFPIRESATTIEYDFAAVGGRQYLLPSRAEVLMAAGRLRTRNLAAYRDYRKFQTEAVISFGEVEEKPKAPGEKK
jgi:hypothetical protein